jgi:hypothetical protein
MAFRVYSGPRGSQSISALEKDRNLYKELNSLDEAIGWARHIYNGGRVALLIEGDDGTRPLSAKSRPTSLFKVIASKIQNGPGENRGRLCENSYSLTTLLRVSPLRRRIWCR